MRMYTCTIDATDMDGDTRHILVRSWNEHGVQNLTAHCLWALEDITNQFHPAEQEAWLDIIERASA